MESRLVYSTSDLRKHHFSRTVGRYSQGLMVFQVSASYMKMVSSYVMQDDQLFAMLTVFETLMFAAEVRLPPSISRSEKRKRVFELIDQLGLQV